MAVPEGYYEFSNTPKVIPELYTQDSLGNFIRVTGGGDSNNSALEQAVLLMQNEIEALQAELIVLANADVALAEIVTPMTVKVNAMEQQITNIELRLLALENA